MTDQNKTIAIIANTLTNDISEGTYDQDKGLQVVAMIMSNSGFRCQVGQRQVGNLIIQEATADGTGITYFSGIKAFKVDGDQRTLLNEKNFKKGTRYSRQFARKEAEDLIINIIVDSLYRQNVKVQASDLMDKVRDLLDKSYFEQTDEAIMGLMKEWELLL
ncbi:hypothetical protein [Flammeovirga sp. SJP92]|uniref:hypothetical protein n=1 Tax=Flammeovirga sp. SJP92 TaxID=1775430 RepID=UPI000786A2BD|nr:hypothetical protein [Flammeovirga sp. SJP92]KXX70809.1 hypothetical protein AVL50_11540 [Flammeovirga sp. SJP92]